MPILSLILWSPLVLGLLLLFLPAEPVTIPRRAAFVFSLVPFLAIATGCAIGQISISGVPARPAILRSSLRQGAGADRSDGHRLAIWFPKIVAIEDLLV